MNRKRGRLEFVLKFVLSGLGEDDLLELALVEEFGNRICLETSVVLHPDLFPGKDVVLD